MSQVKKIELSIVILSYNVKDLMGNCLRSIPDHSNWEIIIPDNGSTDDSLEYIKNHFKGIKVIDNKKNLGFAAGNNVGIKEAKGEYILLLNPDTIVQPGTIETVLEYMKVNPQVGAATCRVELPDGNLDYSSHRGFPYPWAAALHFLGLRRFSSYSATKIPDQTHEIDALTGAFAMIRKFAGDQVNWLDEDYFWNGEDLDFCYKLKQSGWKIMFLPQVKIIHYKGSSAKATKETRKNWALNSTDVMRIFYKKHLAKKYPSIFNQLVYLSINILEKIRVSKN